MIIPMKPRANCLLVFSSLRMVVNDVESEDIVDAFGNFTVSITFLLKGAVKKMMAVRKCLNR